MTEYTTDPDAIAHYLAARARTANWVDSLSGKSLVAPSVPPSLVSDTDDGLSSQDSDAESSRSLPPRMILRYPDGRPDVAVSGNTQWPSQAHKLPGTSPTHHSRPQPGSYGHHPSNPNIHSRAASNAVPLYVTPPPPVIATHPETIHVRPSPTNPGTNTYFTDPTNSSAPSRSRSKHSSRPPPAPLQMIYAPPPPAPSSHSHSAPVSPTGGAFQATQQPPPVPPPPPQIVTPSPVYGFPSRASAHDPPQPAPLASSKTHSRTHSYSSNHSHPHPSAPQPPIPGPPSSYTSGSAQRPRRHSSRAGSSHPDATQFALPESQNGSHIGSSFNSTSSSRRHGPPSIIYAPSANSSSYTYNPPVITSYPPPSMTMHAPVPHHAKAHRMAQSISDPTPVGGSLGRSGTRGRLFENFSRTPSPTTARARAKESSKKYKSQKDKLRRKQRDGGVGRGNDDDDGASFSSGSTYYVLPSPGQKIKVVPPTSMKGLYAEPTSASASKSTPALQSHRSANGPYIPPPPLPPPPRAQKRPLLQRIFHPQFGQNSNASATYGSLSSWRSSRR
ncbi:hypothetical protein BC827DRAFT_1268468 [Russula dissimulans]|nr:hypothetical protein BC827DRAFT_1268468 [Russula dissimulans]